MSGNGDIVDSPVPIPSFLDVYCRNLTIGLASPRVPCRENMEMELRMLRENVTAARLRAAQVQQGPEPSPPNLHAHERVRA